VAVLEDTVYRSGVRAFLCVCVFMCVYECPWVFVYVYMLHRSTPSQGTLTLDMSAVLLELSGNSFMPLEVFIESDYAGAE
jgi:hypothetical protein